MLSNQNVKSAFKLALLEGLTNASKIEIIEKILDQEGDINFAIPVDSPRQKEIGYTALHFACSKRNFTLFKSLLKYGADFTKQNNDGQSVLHMLIERKTEITEPLDNPYINAVLSAHINSKNFSNPHNKDGISHFHIACMTNNSEAVQFFLESEVSLDASVNVDSTSFPGYTALHFAAMCLNLKVMELIVTHGVNMHIAGGKGETVLHLLLKRKLDKLNILDTLREGPPGLTVQGHSYEKIQEKIVDNDKFINVLLENMSTDNDSLDEIGLSNFHIACTMQNIAVAQNLVDQVTDLDHCVNWDSKLWPGYTALHFAAYSSIEIVKMLIGRGANLQAKDSKGLTPLNICIKKYELADICNLMSLNDSWNDILFSNGRTKLLSFIQAMGNLGKFKKFVQNSVEDINMFIPLDSSLWPGYTPLHLAVLFTQEMQCMASSKDTKVDLKIVQFCLERGADLNMQDSKRQTALHLAFRLKKMSVVDYIFCHSKSIPDVSDEENLSHLHIACATVKIIQRFKKCLMNNADVNAKYNGTTTINRIRPGSTPLHACRGSYTDGKIKILLKAGANPYLKDAAGLTATHWLLEYFSGGSYVGAVPSPLLSKVMDDCVAEEYGLSHLHVACVLENELSVKRLLKNGADMNLAIKYTKRNEDDPLSFLEYFNKCTPLHLASRGYAKLPELLLNKGANVFAEKADGTTALDRPGFLNYFISKLKKNLNLQERVKREFGWTKLHVACYLLEHDKLGRLLKDESADINAKVFPNSPIWKGYTPLHMLMDHSQNIIYQEDLKAYIMTEILVKIGADVSLIDDYQNTPVGLLLKRSPIGRGVYYKKAVLLIRNQKDFKVSPVNDQGVTNFHLACYLNDLTSVEGFLKHGADVNQPIDFFSNWHPGDTPLHLASQLQVIDSLISYGGDIHKENVRVCSVLAEALRRDLFDKNVITKIMKSGANMNSLNVKGQTPFEIAILSGKMTMEKLLFCIRQGFVVNSCNPITGSGYIAIILGNYYEDQKLKTSIIERIMVEHTSTIFGRTTLHHIVTSSVSAIKDDDYFNLFEKLVQSGIDIDVQDDEGKTALHLATEFDNFSATSMLLMHGADVNVLDKNGKTALSYTMHRLLQVRHNRFDRNFKCSITEHLCKLSYLKLDLCRTDATLIMQNTIKDYYSDEFVEQVAQSSKIKVGVRSICLYDFLSETGAVVVYSFLSKLERTKIDEFLKGISKNTEVEEIRGILKLQHGKAIKRIELLSLATNSFRLLLGFDLPYLCIENLFQYLHNSDLKNIVSVENLNNNTAMDVD